MIRAPLTALLCVLILPCTAQNSFLKKYSGAYNIIVDGYSGNAAEAYALSADGTAVWVYGYKDSSGGLQTQKKSGSWRAQDGIITISINGDTGKITEVYRWKNGRFLNTEEPSRWLKKRP